jgi:predicted amidohydrolase
MPLRIACLQLNPGDDVQENVEAALSQAREACDNGAQLLLLPEFAFVLHASGRIMRETAVDETSHPGIAAFRKLSMTRGVWTLIGSATVKTGDERIANRAYLIDSVGEVFASYDKIHMFDATLPSGRMIRESAMYRPGKQAVVARTPFATIGITICYDLRFPQLYRSLAHSGADLIVVPSAFTQATGKMHWHTLLRARAIENGCFVAAPATCGTHPGGHQTFGHSLVVDPSGHVIADGGEAPAVCYADIDLEEVTRVRERMPTLHHDRSFSPAESKTAN